MRPALFFLIVILITSMPVLAEPPHIHHDGPVAGPAEVLDLEQVWHRGHEEDEVFFGAIRNISLGPDGNIYALDTQKSEVAVFDAAGEFLRTLSREGEGPGECRRPEDQVFLPDGTLGIAQYINGKIIKIDLDGTPRETLMPPGFDPLEGGALSSIRRVRYRGGSLVINGVRVSPDGDGMKRTQYLVRCDEHNKPLTEYLSRSVPANLMRDGWVEKDHYFPSHERWDIDDQGLVVAATERNAYLITVFAPDGSVLRTFGRKAESWRRTEAEKQEIRDSLTVLRDGQRVEVEVQVEDAEPAIRALYCRPNGEIWVLPGTGAHAQPEGVMCTFDVFSAEGRFLRQVALACPGDPGEDGLFFLGDDRLALVRGAVQARRNSFGGSRGEEKDVPIHDLIVYRIL